MRKFTFIAEYRGGTYISQYKATNLIDALFLWADNLETQYFADRIKAKIQNEVRIKYLQPLPIENVENVWCHGYVIYRSLLLLNIIETV